MKDIEFANKLAKLACYRWFNQNLKEVYTQLCICLLNAANFDAAKQLLQDEHEHIDCAQIIEYIPDEDIFDDTMQLVYR